MEWLRTAYDWSMLVLSFGIPGRKTKKRLAEAYARLKALIQLQRDPMWETDASGGNRSINEPMRTLLGVGQDGFAGREWYYRIHHDDRDTVVREFGAAIKEKRGYRGQFRMLHSSGSVILVDCVGIPMRDEESGEIFGWLGTVIPVAKKRGT